MRRRTFFSVAFQYVLLLSYLYVFLLSQQAHGADPVINDGGIVNSASYSKDFPELAPGSIATIFGSDLRKGGKACLPADSCFSPFDEKGRVRTKLAGTQVTINGTPVPIFFASRTQLGVQIPTDLTGTSATVQIMVGDATSEPHTILIQPHSPGIFSLSQDGIGAGIITHLDGSLVSPSNPAPPGDFIIIWATGLGQVTPFVPTGERPGEVARTLSTPTVMIDGLPAKVSFSGLSDCCVGLNQINVLVPLNARLSREVSVFLEIGGIQSNTVTIATGTPLSITTTSLAAGTQNTAYSATLAATGGQTPYSWSISAGMLPAGLFLMASTGVISGTPTETDTSNFTVRVSDASSQTATQALSITINPAGGSVSHSVDLMWDASTSSVIGYNVYRSTTSGGPYTKLNSTVVAGTTYTDSSVEAGQTYFYVTKSVDASNTESVPSNEATAVIPVL